MGHLRDPVVGRPRDQMMGRSGDVPGTFRGRRSYMFFLIRLRNILNLL